MLLIQEDLQEENKGHITNHPRTVSRSCPVLVGGLSGQAPVTAAPGPGEGDAARPAPGPLGKASRWSSFHWDTPTGSPWELAARSPLVLSDDNPWPWARGKQSTQFWVLGRCGRTSSPARPHFVPLCNHRKPFFSLYCLLVYYQGPLRFYFSTNNHSSIIYIVNRMRKISQGCYGSQPSWQNCLTPFKIIIHPLFIY